MTLYETQLSMEKNFTARTETMNQTKKALLDMECFS